MFEGFVMFWTMLMFLLPGFWGHNTTVKKGETPKEEIHKTVATLPSPPPSITPAHVPEDKKIPTPALLPGLMIFLGSALRKKG